MRDDVTILGDLLKKLLGVNLSPKPAPAPAPAGFRPQDLVDAMNVERARLGLGPLVLDAKLTAVAQDWAQVMADRGVLDHGNFFGRIKAAIPVRSAAEVIAEGQASVAAVMDSWLRSPPHRANICGVTYNRCGVGRAITNGVEYFVADFVER